MHVGQVLFGLSFALELIHPYNLAKELRVDRTRLFDHGEPEEGKSPKRNRACFGRQGGLDDRILVVMAHERQNHCRAPRVVRHHCFIVSN